MCWKDLRWKRKVSIPLHLNLEHLARVMEEQGPGVYLQVKVHPLWKDAMCWKDKLLKDKMNFPMHLDLERLAGMIKVQDTGGRLQV